MTTGDSLPKLVDLMRRLLGPEGCPWDREQTPESLRQYVIEEAHEVADAIDRKEWDELRGELGDLLLQVVFLSALMEQQKRFDVDAVVEAIVEKLVRRHPWVFGDKNVSNANEAVGAWEEIKAKERSAEESALDGVPLALPSLLRAQRIGEKASSVGYDWPDAHGPREKINEELAELDAALKTNDKAHIESELGDTLFALATFGRKLGLDSEAALRGTLNRFSERFKHCEQQAAQAGKTLRDYDDAELDQLWARAKIALR